MEIPREEIRNWGTASARPELGAHVVLLETSKGPVWISTVSWERRWRDPGTRSFTAS